MTKTQKIWFAVFLAMFLVQEALLGSVRWFIFRVFFPVKNMDFLYSSLIPAIGNNFIVFFVYLVQFIGIVGVSILLIKSKINVFLKIIIFGVLLFLIFVTGILLWMGIYNLFNSPQIG